MAVGTNGRKITRDDLEAAFSQVIGEGEATAEAAVPQVALIAGTVALAVVTLAYLAGRRRGRRRSAVVEIRRV
jgi:cystathionine beta-lyase family protein involved in aluminum resistance